MPSKKIRTLFIITLHIFSHFARTFNLHEVYWLYLTRVTWISLTIYRLSYLYPRSPEGVYCFTSVRPSVQYIFHRIFLIKYWWQKSDIWSQVSYRYAILWEAFLDPADSYFLFAEEQGYHKWALAHSSSCYRISKWDPRCRDCMVVVSSNSLRQTVLNTTLCDTVCQWLTISRWFSLGTPVSSTNKTDRHDIAEILLKVALNTITLPFFYIYMHNLSH